MLQRCLGARSRAANVCRRHLDDGSHCLTIEPAIQPNPINPCLHCRGTQYNHEKYQYICATDKPINLSTDVSCIEQYTAVSQRGGVLRVGSSLLWARRMGGCWMSWGEWGDSERKAISLQLVIEIEILRKRTHSFSTVTDTGETDLFNTLTQARDTISYWPETHSIL